MKRNKAPVCPMPPVFKGIYSVSPKWTDVVIADLVQIWREIWAGIAA